MGLFDIFKTKVDQPTPERLSLETLLQKAATEPAIRSEFHKRLLSDNLIVVTNDSGRPDGKSMADKGSKVNIFHYPDGKIPVFTSKQRLFDKGIVKEQVKVLEMKGKDLFTLAIGASFLLNPYSDYGKELIPDEISQMLNGTIFTSNPHNEILVEKATTVLLAQPAKYPTELVEALQHLFSQKPNIRAAYLGWIHDPSSKVPPHYIFAIEGEGELKSVTNEAGSIANQFLKPGEVIDIIRIDDKGGLSDYFLNKTQPFFKR